MDDRGMSSVRGKKLSRPAAWKLALMAGFAMQLLLLVFVTAIGLRQLEVTTDNLDRVVEVHMRKQNLTREMVTAARERTVTILTLAKIRDRAERERMLDAFRQNGRDFGAARHALLKLPLTGRESELIALQGRLTAAAQPIQLQVIDLIDADFVEDAETLIIEEAIPMQNEVIAALAELDAEARRGALAASFQAREDQRVARAWMFVLSGAALLLGLLVAAYVFRYTNRVGRERERLATQDTLTGLPNRMLFMDRLEQALIRAKRNKTRVGVMFIDLDRFKRVNDTLGHASGDQLIREVARRLRATVRAEDVVARLGGDEFVVVLSDARTVTHILQVVEKMLHAVSAPYEIAGRELFCSCSVGVSVFPDDGDDSSALLRHADTAMYHAKRNGRNRFQLYSSAMNALAEERLQLETELHYAVDRGELVFHYQPQINLDTGRVHGLEALIRWQHPQKGLLAPIAFLDMLEESGTLVAVGRTLMRQACRETARWHAEGFPDLMVAVNLSGQEFWHDELVDEVRNALTETGLPPHALQLELTEGIFMEDMDAAANRIQALKALGVSVAIDDFGTGYSSLAHLKRFALDVLKIDRYFVKDIQRGPVNAALISSILALCKGLKLGTVAEGVEDAEQLATLRELGCSIVQGYLISRPVAADAIPELLARDWRQPGRADASAVASPAH